MYTYMTRSNIQIKNPRHHYLIAQKIFPIFFSKPKRPERKGHTMTSLQTSAYRSKSQWAEIWKKVQFREAQPPKIYIV